MTSCASRSVRTASRSTAAGKRRQPFASRKAPGSWSRGLFAWWKTGAVGARARFQVKGPGAAPKAVRLSGGNGGHAAGMPGQLRARQSSLGHVRRRARWRALRRTAGRSTAVSARPKRKSPGSCEPGLVVTCEWRAHRTCGPGGDLLSHALGHSTIGAEGLNGRVRDGNGCGPLAITTRSARSMRIVETCDFVGLQHMDEAIAVHEHR